MGRSTNDMPRCATVYTITEYFTSVLFFLVSVSLTIVYYRLRSAINKCAFSFDRDTIKNIEILFRFLVSSFLLQTVYLIWWAASSKHQHFVARERYFYARVITQNLTPVLFDATSILVIFVLHKNSFAPRP